MDEKVKAVKKSLEISRPPLKFAELTLSERSDKPNFRRFGLETSETPISSRPWSDNVKGGPSNQNT